MCGPLRRLTLALLWGLLLAASALAEEGQLLTNRYAITPAGERVPLRAVWTVVPYWQTGNYHFPVQNFTYYLDAQGKRVMHGVFSFRYLNGKAVEFTTFAHGRREGPFQSLGPDFRVRSTGAYHNGELHGEVTWFYGSGGLRRVETYDQGELHGPYRAYHGNGGLQEEGAFVQGVKQGPVAWYHPNGTLAGEGTYREGYLSGTIRLFDEQGRKRAEGTLREEWIVGPWQCYRADGRVAVVREDCDGQFFDRCDCP